MPSTRDSPIVARSEIASERRDRNIGYRQVELPLVTRTFGGLRSVSSIADFRFSCDGPQTFGHPSGPTTPNERRKSMSSSQSSKFPLAAQRTLWPELARIPAARDFHDT